MSSDTESTEGITEIICRFQMDYVYHCSTLKSDQASIFENITNFLLNVIRRNYEKKKYTTTAFFRTLGACWAVII